MYAYSGYLWPSLASAVFIAYLAVYGWRHRKVAGALPFSIACLFGVAWSLGSMLGHAAVDLSDKIFWLKFVDAFQLPVVTTATCFVLQYAGWGRLLTKRTVALLAVPPVLAIGFIATDHVRASFWEAFIPAGNGLQSVLGPAGSAFLDYSYILMIVNIGLLLWVAATSPARRKPAALMALGQIGARLFFEFGVLRLGLPLDWDPDPFVLVAVFGLYAIALFLFHVFDPIPAARAAAIDQMSEGMIVVDLEGRIVEVNPAAEMTLGAPAARLRGVPVADFIPMATEVVADACNDGNGHEEVEVGPGDGGPARRYRVERTPLHDRQGHGLGHLLLLHDITEERRTQALVVEHERVVATLQERERLARELHDSVGQVLGYVSMQTQTVMKWLSDGDGARALPLLARLAEVAQGAHTDVRESILALKAASADEWSFLPTLSRYLDDCRVQYGIHAEFSVAPEVTEDAFEPRVAVQLLRVVQEALTNARRHGRAGGVRVAIVRDGDRLRMTISDDGCGFEPDQAGERSGGHFGLAFMRERMQQIGGTVEIDSSPGLGTSVILEAPIPAAQEATR